MEVDKETSFAEPGTQDRRAVKKAGQATLVLCHKRTNSKYLNESILYDQTTSVAPDRSRTRASSRPRVVLVFMIGLACLLR